MRLAIASWLGVTLAAGVASGKTVHVDERGSASGDGSAGNPFKRIAQGLAAAADGDTVSVAPGTYPEGPVLVTKSVALVGSLVLERDARGLATGAVAGTETVILGHASDGPDTVVIRADHVTVRGFIVDGGSPWPSTAAGLSDIRVAGNEAPGAVLTGIVIAHNWVSDSNFGILVYSADVALSGNLVGDGAQARLDGKSPHGNFIGVNIQGSDTDRPVHVTVDHMRVSRNVHTGMVVVGGAHIGANRPAGVTPTGAVVLDVDSSDFSYAGALGVHVIGWAPFGSDRAYPAVVDMTITRSTITGNAEYGLVIDHAGVSESPLGCGGSAAVTLAVNLADSVDLSGNSRAGTLVTPGYWARPIGYSSRSCYLDNGSLIDASFPTAAGLNLDVPYCAATLVPDAYAATCSPHLDVAVEINGTLLTPGILSVSPKTF